MHCECGDAPGELFIRGIFSALKGVGGVDHQAKKKPVTLVTGFCCWYPEMPLPVWALEPSVQGGDRIWPQASRSCRACAIARRQIPCLVWISARGL